MTTYMELATRIGPNKPPRTSLAALESLSFPLVQEIVLSVDVRCKDCQRRLACMMDKVREVESVVVDVLEKKVTLICRYSSNTKEPSCLRQVAMMLYKNRKGKLDLVKRMFRSSFEYDLVPHKHVDT